jgi:flagellar motor switch/type III secretory pathway protein FliN
MAPRATAESRAWLPAEAIASERIEPMLAAALLEWSCHWFASSRAAIGPAFQDDWPAGADSAWRSARSFVSVAAGASAKPLIASAMLGSGPPHGNQQPGDKIIVDALASRCIDDLLARLARLAGAALGAVDLCDEAIDLPGCSCWEVSLGTRKAVLKIALTAPTAIGIVKQKLARPPAPKLQPLARGFASQEVEIAADLGRCSISLAELEGLAAGDILVLDRSPAKMLELLVCGAPSPLKALLEAKDERPVLLLAPQTKADHA